jgi:hypothetical protein
LEAQRHQTTYANEHRQHLEFNVGDKVLLSTKNIEMSIDRNCPTKKLLPKYCGLYMIIKKMSSLVYKLDLPATLRIHLVFYISMLKAYEDTNEFLRSIPLPMIPNASEEDEYKVENVLDKRTIQKKMQYFVK